MPTPLFPDGIGRRRVLRWARLGDGNSLPPVNKEARGSERKTGFSRLSRWQDALREPCLGLLLSVQVVFVFVVAPMTSAGLLRHTLVDGFQLLLALVSAFVVTGIGVTRIVIIVGLGLTLVTSSLGIDAPVRPLHFVGLLLFTPAVTWGVARTVFSPGPVTHHRVLGAVVIYLNLALIFAVLFSLITFLSPAAFVHISADPRFQFGQLLYFSLATLTTTGYGDIVPLHPIARSLSNLEAVVGQLFLAILLARLVNLHLTHRENS